MAEIGKARFWILFALAATLAATVRSFMDGDGIEYLLMTHAFASHGSASLTAADFSQVIALNSGVYDQLTQTAVATPYSGFARTGSGEIYSIHFWLYSLMAVPFYAAVTWLGLKPTLAFSLLNLTLVGATLRHLHRSMPGASRAAAMVFLSLGTAFYLRWTGPEVMTACCAFAAALCVLRRDTSVAILLSGIGATQNPSLALFIPLIAAHRLFALKVPAVVTLPMVRRPVLFELALATAGVFAALAPFAFYYSAFGIPSLIAPYFTDPAHITPRRALSFMVDLDQGVLAGLPGLLLGLFGVAAVRSALDQRAAAANGLFFLLASCVIATPTLAALNWNSATSGLLRYAYWAAMPLAAFLVSALPMMAPRSRMHLVSAIIVAQGCAVLAGGLMMPGASYLQHTPLSTWALAAVPRLVNPDPEIVLERGRHSDGGYTSDMTRVFFDNAVPVKLLRHRSNSHDSAGLCPEGQQVNARSVVDVDRGWQYLNGPLSCASADRWGSPLRLRFAGASAARSFLASGWAGAEQTGTWTNGKRSVIRLRVPPGSEVTEIYFVGHYFAGLRASAVHLNGKLVGSHSLAGGQVDVPQGLAGEELEIALVHDDAASPAQLGLSADTRVLAYFLRDLQLHLRPRRGADARAAPQVGWRSRAR